MSVRARKHHTCCRCGDWIAKGAIHKVWTWFEAGGPWHRHISGPDAVAVEAAVMAAFAALPRIGTKDVHL